jgi:uncharacterized cofD-like protein
MRLLWANACEPSAAAAISGAAAALGLAIAHATAIELRDAGDSCVFAWDLDAREATPAQIVGEIHELTERGGRAIAVGTAIPLELVRELFTAGASDVIGAPLHHREVILRLGAVAYRKFRVACIGGGTGLFTVLDALKTVPHALLASIVTMSDDGGSSGRLRTSFGVLPPGDVRRSLVALSNAPEVMNFVMQYRFAAGDGLSGHSLGNLLLTAMAERTGGMQSAVKALRNVLNVQGLVMCVTEKATTLCAEFEDRRIVRGESAIDRCLERPANLRVKSVWHEPDAETSIDVLAALLAADLIVIGPGDLYTSVLSALIVRGVADGVRRSTAKRLYVCNLMTKPGETEGYDAGDHVAAVVGALGEDVLDYVLVASSELDADAVGTYAAQGQRPIPVPSVARMREVTRAELIAADVGHRAQLVRHDDAKLRGVIVQIAGRDRR